VFFFFKLQIAFLLTSNTTNTPISNCWQNNSIVVFALEVSYYAASTSLLLFHLFAFKLALSGSIFTSYRMKNSTKID